jgi:hypothetical protein
MKKLNEVHHIHLHVYKNDTEMSQLLDFAMLLIL